MKVAFIGANGKMGKSMIDGVIVEKDMQIVGAVDIDAIGKEIAVDSGVFIENDVEEMIRTKDPDVVVDFTSPSVIKNNIMKVLASKKHIVVGTTGLSAADLEEIDAEAPLFGDGLGLDSIDALEIILILEKYYGVKLANSAEAKPAFYSVKTLAEYIMQTNGIQEKQDKTVIPCFEREYVAEGIDYMDVYIAVE